MKKFIEEFKKNLAAIPTKVEQTTFTGFLTLLILLFLLPGGSLLCLAAIYFKIRNN